MGLNCRFSMMRWRLPSLQSPSFPNNSSPICYSPSTSMRNKEACLESARLSFLAIISDDDEILSKDSFRVQSCLSLPAETTGDDYSSMELRTNRRSQKGLHNMISDSQMSIEKDTSIFLSSLKACSTSHFRLLMENINVLEDRIAESNSEELERDILVQLGRLGVLDLFHECLSRTLTSSTASGASDTVTELTGNDHMKYRLDDATKIVVHSWKKRELKSRRRKPLRKVNKRSSESVEQDTGWLPASSAREDSNSKRRITVTKNEAEMSRGIKVAANLEKIRAKLEKESGQAVNLSSWAEAAGIDEKVLQQQLHFGWHCRDEILRSARPLVLYLARNYRGLGVPSEDLLQAGNIGVLQGAERFDHTRGYKFSTYVQYWIRKAMSALVSRNAKGIKIPLNLITAINRIQKARQALHKTHGKHPDDIEIAKFTGLSLNKIQSARKCLRVVGSIDQQIADWSSVKFLECTPDTSIETPERVITRKNMKSKMIKLLNGLDPKERQVLVLRYGLGGHQQKSLDEIGKLFRVSKEWIRRMERRALTKLRDEANRMSLSHYLDLYA
ncbi:hypothetical protein Ancab_002066 [Ancistrocladus abbreviatus]